MKIALLLPHLRTGGIERGMVTLLQSMTMSSDIDVIVVLQSRDGDLLTRLPAHVMVEDLQGAKVWHGAQRLAKILRKHAVDVVWTATNATNVMALLAGHRMGRTAAPKFVLGEHIPLNAFLDMRRFAPLRRLIMRHLYPTAAAITAPLQPILDEHAALLGTTCPRCAVLPNPVVHDVVPARPLAATARHFVTLGRLSPEKDYDLALRTFAHIRDKKPEARLTLYGEGPERGRLEALVDELGLADCVALPGVVADAQTAFAGADMLWCTSHVEGFGNVLVEAMANGVPVASVDCPFGPAHLLGDNLGGLLCQTRDPARLAKLIVTFAEDLTARSTTQAAGFEIAHRYTAEQSVKAHIAFFQSL